VTGVDNLSAGSPAANLESAHRHNGPGRFTFIVFDVQRPGLSDIAPRMRRSRDRHLQHRHRRTNVGHRAHQRIAAAVGVSRPPEYADARTGEVHASALDPTRASRVLGWKPDADLTEGIKHTVDWLRAILEPDRAALARA
jgi:hypothetical protein